MSDPDNEPIRLQVGGPDENGVHRWETESFTGERLDYFEEHGSLISLYRWLDRGYFVYVEDENTDEKSLYPLTSPRRGFTAEEVAEHWPRFANSVGITPDTDIDFP